MKKRKKKKKKGKKKKIFNPSSIRYCCMISRMVIWKVHIMWHQNRF